MAKYHYLRATNRLTTRAVLKLIEHNEIDIHSGSYGFVKTLMLLRNMNLGRQDVILTDSTGKSAFSIVLYKLIRRYRVVVRLRGDNIASIRQLRGKFPRARYLLTLLLLRNSDLVIFNSLHVMKDDKYKTIKSHAALVYNPLMIDKGDRDKSNSNRSLRQRTAPFKLLSVMNFGPVEKFSPLEKALTEWVDDEFLRKHNIEWSIIGGGAHLNNFRDKITARYPDGRVTVYGFRDDVHSFYETHDVLAHLSGFDSLPNAILEASVNCLPILTLPISGGSLEAMRDGETGMIVHGASSFKAAVLRYRRDPALRRLHGENGRRFVASTFTVEQQQTRMCEVLNKHFG